MIHVTHLIPSGHTGGAETTLLKLLSHTDRRRFHSEVVTLMDAGPIGERLRQMGYEVTELRMKKSVSILPALARLSRHLRARRIDILQTWMHYCDLLSPVVRFRGAAVVWNVRGTLDRRRTKRTEYLAGQACARLSRRVPDAIVCCSDAAAANHRAFGYCGAKMWIIPNGFDIESFRPDPAARLSVRGELKIPAEAPLIGLIARFHPQKDHRTFLIAGRRIRQAFGDVRFLLAGPGIDRSNLQLRRWIDEQGLSDHCFLLGQRSDVPRLTAALDIAASSSAFGEGFPNVIGEAMASGVPCAATDSGAAAEIIGDLGRMAPVEDPERLAAGCIQLLQMSASERAELGAACRSRIAARYSLQAATEAYQQLYTSLAASGAAQ